MHPRTQASRALQPAHELAVVGEQFDERASRSDGSLGDGLWEVRSSLHNRIARVLFCVADDTMWLRHGFIKKQQKTPPQDLALARRRMRGVLDALRRKGG